MVSHSQRNFHAKFRLLPGGGGVLGLRVDGYVRGPKIEIRPFERQNFHIFGTLFERLFLKFWSIFPKFCSIFSKFLLISTKFYPKNFSGNRDPLRGQLLIAQIVSPEIRFFAGSTVEGGILQTKYKNLGKLSFYSRG